MKRKRLDIDKMERDSLLKKVLPTNATVPLPNSIPLDGFQYLAMVQREAKSIPDVMVAAINVKEQDERIHEARKVSSLLPCSNAIGSTEWSDKFIQKFKKLKRDYSRNLKSLEKLPCRSEAFWKNAINVESMQPTLSILSQINHTLALKLVKFISNWVIQDFSTIYGQWLFCLFIIIDPLLTSDQVNILRDLARNLQNINQESLNNSQKASIQIILSIIAGIFGQKDLLVMP